MRLTTLSILLALSTALHAAMIMPPEMDTPADFEKFAKQMRDEMPSLVTYRSRLAGSLPEWAQKIDALADRLKKDREFLKLSADRPDPVSFLFYSYSERREKTNGIDPEFVAHIQNYFRSVYADLYEESEERFLEKLKARILELGNESLAQPFMGLSAGLAMLLPADQRREVLGGRKSLEERAHVLLAAIEKISDEELRQVFQSERFGVPRAEMTKLRAIEMLNMAVQREQELTISVSLLEAYENGNLEDIDSEDITWFTGDDAGGLPTGLPEALLERLRGQARNSYSSVTEDKVIRTPQTRLIVKEMPPHLAVFRGCPGGDCSTTSSWAYPFSPLERDYYIYSPGNQIAELGYVSATIVEVNGKKTFFIRDITGRRLAPDHIDLIIEGFAQMLPQLGVKQMTLATPEFTSAQNHFPRLHHRIGAYTVNLKTVRQDFADDSIRRRLIAKTPDVNEYYDGPGVHDEARLYDDSKVAHRAGHIGAQVITPEEAAELPSGGDEEKLQLLIIGYLSNLQFFIKSANPAFTKWQEFKDALKNRKGLTIKKYFASLQKHFEEFGLPLTQNLIEKAPDLFYEGQMNASDALKGENAERSFAMVVDRYVERREAGTLAKLRGNKPEFFASQTFKGLVNEIFARLRPIDGERIKQLWRFGYRFDIEMNEEQTSFFLNALNELSDTHPEMLPELADLYYEKGQVQNLNMAKVLKLTRWLPVYSRAINSEKWIRALMIVSHFRIRNAQSLSMLKRAFENPGVGLQARFAAAIALVKSDLDKPENISIRAYTLIRTGLETGNVSEGLKQRAREVLAELGEQGMATLDKRMAKFISAGVGKQYLGMCEFRVTR